MDIGLDPSSFFRSMKKMNTVTKSEEDLGEDQRADEQELQVQQEATRGAQQNKWKSIKRLMKQLEAGEQLRSY